MILKKAWKTKILMGNKQIYFDHDYPAEVVQKRKAYNGIKKVLKENGIRFQTPLTRIRIHWNSGIKMYHSAREASLDMKERGYGVDPSGDDGRPAAEGRRRAVADWQRVRGKDQGREAAHRARERLQVFLRKT